MRISLLLVILLSFLLLSCSQKGDSTNFTNDPILYAKTVKELNNVVLDNNFPPMVASRIYAYASIAAYEVVALGNSAEYQSLAGQLKGLSPMPAPTDTAGVDFPYAAMVAFCKTGMAVTFPEKGNALGDYLQQLQKRVDSAGMSATQMKKSEALAETVSQYILEWSKKDNYLQTRSASKFTITADESRWQPTPPRYDPAIEPHWPEIRTLVIDSAAQFMPPRPPVYDVKNKNGAYYKMVMEVKNTIDSLTPEQKHIADFWDDSPFRSLVSGHFSVGLKKFSPPGHWLNIVGIAAMNNKADFNTTVYAYAKTAIALFDGFISCWDEKYRSVYVRPETVINKYIAPEWRPYIETPPFPEYTSGHSVISAAAAEALTSVFGDNKAYRDSSEAEFGIKDRNFTSFRQAAIEASYSRLYGGIHFRPALENGNLQGKKLGEYLNSRLRMKRVKN